MKKIPEKFAFSAETRVVFPDSRDLMAKLCSHFEEHGRVTQMEDRADIETDFGRAKLHAGADALTIAAQGSDETYLTFIKLAMAEHLLAFAGDEKPKIVWTGHGAAGSLLPYFREMRVVKSENITPHMRRVTLRGENLARFAVGGLHVRLLFPAENSTAPKWPLMGEDGRPVWPEGSDRPQARVYTIRNLDPENDMLDIDMVLHEGSNSPGSNFASNAKPGDIVGMTGPGGGSAGEADWYLLAGDETALPAIGKLLERLPATAKVKALIEIDSEAEEQDLVSNAQLDLRWLNRNGAEPGTTDLLYKAISKIEWPETERVFAWVGCEHASFRTIRKYLRNERKLSREEHLVVAYWRRGVEGDDARKLTAD
ncbi:siderophore-interacting protein [Mesorhizobium sp. SB112]|uniref:siderophore-interacting protein n=1 Tax=Mesorhizobium sp. SB112 TaxID=3151853 RepID=UPI003263D2E3